MAWITSFEPHALGELKKLDRTAQRRIVKFLQERISGDKNPRHVGKAMVGDEVRLWRYRVGNYRLVCKIDDDRLEVLVLRVGHRKDVYR